MSMLMNMFDQLVISGFISRNVADTFKKSHLPVAEMPLVEEFDREGQMLASLFNQMAMVGSIDLGSAQMYMYSLSELRRNLSQYLNRQLIN